MTYNETKRRDSENQNSGDEEEVTTVQGRFLVKQRPSQCTSLNASMMKKNKSKKQGESERKKVKKLNINDLLRIQ